MIGLFGSIAVRPVDLIVVILYLALMAAMAIYFARRNTSTEEYFVGGRSFPGWALGMSMMATSVSSVTFLAFPAAAYAGDFRDLVINLLLPVGVVIAVIAFIPFFRRGRLTSAYEYLGKRYGPIIRLYGTISFMIMRLGWLGIVLCLISQVIAVLTGWPIVPVIVGTGLFIALYTVVGGIDAVIWTDVIQGFVLMIGGLVTVFCLVWGLPGGLGQVIDIGVAEGKFGLGAMNWDPNRQTFWTSVILGVFTWIAYQTDQNIVQRYVAARSTREARKATIIYGAIAVPTWAFFFFVGTCLFVYFKISPDPELDRLSNEQVLPYFILTRVPAGAAGIIVAGILSAAMSSVDSTLNAIATVSVVDIVKPHIAKGRDDRFYLIVARVLAGAASLIMIALAAMLSQVPTTTINQLDWAIGSLFAGCLMGLFVLGIFSTRVNYSSALCGLTIAILTNAYLVLGVLKWLPQAMTLPVHQFWVGPIVNVTFILVAYSTAWLFRHDKDRLAGLTIWTAAGD